MILCDEATLYCLLVICFIVTAHSSTEEEFCKSYINCAHKLEQKQRECLELQIKRSKDLRNNCSNLSETYRALELRRTELYRDCVENRMAQFPFSTITAHANTCSKLAKKYASSTSKLSKRQQKKLSKRKKNSKARELKECRISAKLWHKHCRRLAKCCPIYTQCSNFVAMIQKQLNEEKQRFYETRAQCIDKGYLKKRYSFKKPY